MTHVWILEYLEHKAECSAEQTGKLKPYVDCLLQQWVENILMLNRLFFNNNLIVLGAKVNFPFIMEIQILKNLFFSEFKIYIDLKINFI